MFNVKHSTSPQAHFIVVTFIALTIFFLLLSMRIHAAEYRFQPSVNLMIETDDNVNLSSNEINIYSLQGESMTVNADFSRNQADGSFSINNQFSRRQYDLNRYNTEDFTTAFNYQRRFERGSFSINLSANDESIRTLENQLDNDGSTEQRSTKAQSYSVSLSGQRQLTERHMLQNQFSMQQRDYDSNNRNSYDYFSNGLLWMYSISPQLSMQTNLSLSAFRPEKTNGIEYAFIETAQNEFNLSNQVILSRMQFCSDNLDPLDPYNPDTALSLLVPIPNFGSETNCFNTRPFSVVQDSINLQIGLQYQWTENMSVNLLIGKSRSETERDLFSPRAILVTGELTGNYIEESEQNNLSYSADISYQHTALLSTTAKASQSQEKTAYGTLANTRRMKLSSRWQFRESSWLTATLSHTERENDNNVASQATYSDDFTHLNISYRKDWQKHIRSHFTYSYSKREAEGQETSDRNRFIFTLTWQPKASTWSK